MQYLSNMGVSHIFVFNVTFNVILLLFENRYITQHNTMLYYIGTRSEIKQQTNVTLNSRFTTRIRID